MAFVIKKLTPMFTSVLLTANKYTEDAMIGSIIDGAKRAGTLKEYQKVLAVGSSVRSVKVGDLVKINPSRYAVRKFKENSVKNDLMTNEIVGYNFPMEDVNGKTCLLLQENDIEFIVDEWEEVEDKPSNLIAPSKGLIV